MKYLTLPSSIEEQLTAYAKDVIRTPDKYTTFVNQKLAKDIADPSIPGISDEFVLTHDLRTLNWKSINLQVCYYLDLQDIAYPPINTSIELINFLEDELSLNIKGPRGHYLYPKGGYMGWHTNSNTPGTRVYMTYSPQNNSSYFKYYDNTTNTIITTWDKEGWTVRVFEAINDPSNYFWHCVYAQHAPRLSFGYQFD